jgi:hypothetical protein
MVPGDGIEVLQRSGGYTYEQGELRGGVGEERRCKETDGCPLTMSETFSKTSNTVSAMIPKRSQLQKRRGSFEKTKAEGQSRALSGLRVKGYSCSEARFMSPKTEI